MNAVPFDTLKMAEKLENAGFSAQQAAGVTGALADALHEAELTTKGDVERTGAALRGDLAVLRSDMAVLRSDMLAIRAELKADIAQVRTELKADIAHVRTELKGDMAAFRAEVKGDMGTFQAELRADMGRFRSEQRGAIELLRRDMTIRLGTMMVAGFGVMLAAMRYMQLHP